MLVAALVASACTPLGGGSASYSSSELGIEVSRAPSRPTWTPPDAAYRSGAAPSAAALSVAPPTTAPVGTFVAAGERPGIGGCPLFPRDNAFHAAIGHLPVHPGSDRMIAAAGPMNLRAGFSAKPWEGARAGYPVNIVDSRTSRIVSVVGGHYAGTSDLDGHPVPPAPRFEGWPDNRWDRHLLVVDTATCVSHEMIGVSPPWANLLGLWLVDKAVKIDLRSNEYRLRGAVKAGGVSMLAGLVRYDEVATGDLDHVISMSMPNARAGAPVWPARHSDGTNPDPEAPPMGAWFRLRRDVDLSGLGPQAMTIARALQDHGGVVVDTSPSLTLSGEPDLRWDDADLGGLRGLTLDDFEVVDPTPMMTSPHSLRIR
jgi:hypothetical protein